jgi:hypothetical protein
LKNYQVFAFFYGCMGHDVTECGDVHAKESCGWGEWLRVPFQPLVSGRDDHGGRGKGQGRGRGRGVRHGEWMDNEAIDMETSVGDDEDLDGNSSRNREEADDAARRVAMQINLLEHSSQ